MLADATDGSRASTRERELYRHSLDTIVAESSTMINYPADWITVVCPFIYTAGWTDMEEWTAISHIHHCISKFTRVCVADRPQERVGGSCTRWIFAVPPLAGTAHCEAFRKAQWDNSSFQLELEPLVARDYIAQVWPAATRRNVSTRCSQQRLSQSEYMFVLCAIKGKYIAGDVLGNGSSS